MKNKNLLLLVIAIVVVIIGVIQALKPDTINPSDSGFPLGNIAGNIPPKFVLFFGAIMLAITGLFYMVTPKRP